MLIEEEKVEIVEDETTTSTNEKKKSAKKRKSAAKKTTTKVDIKESDDNKVVSEEKDENKKSKLSISNQILDNIEDKEDKIVDTPQSNQISNNNDVQGKNEKDSRTELNTSSNNTTNSIKEAFVSEHLDDKNNEKGDYHEDEYSHKSKGALSIIFITISIFLVLLLIAFGGFTFYNYKNKEVIAKGICINSIDLSYCTKEQAKEKINNYYTEQLSKDIELVYKDYKTFLKTSEIELNYDIDSSIDYAFSYGKNGNIFQDNYNVLASMIKSVNIVPIYTLNQNSLTKFLNSISTELPDAIVESSHYIEGNNLIITKGKPGNIVNIDTTTNNIKTQLTNLAYVNNPITIDVKTQSPKEVNVDEIYTEVHKDPKDAYYTKDPYKITPSENGVDFKVSIDEAKQTVQSAETECEIPLKVLYPSVTTNMIGQEAFPDLLGSFSTNYVSNADRTTNLRLAANKINGTVLMPGEVFSYNGVVGARTIAAGYKNAAIYQDGQVVDGLGGGICQISSTLYNAALFANLEMVELYNHQFVPSYVTAGRDATVVYGVKDFKFKNSRQYAIKITCSVSGGVAKFQIWGVKEPTEYDVSVYANVSRTSSYIKATTYRTLKLNGETVKTEKISNSTYKVH